MTAARVRSRRSGWRTASLLAALLFVPLLTAQAPAAAEGAAVVHRYQVLPRDARTWTVAVGDQDAGLRCRGCGTRIPTSFPVTVFGRSASSVYVTASGTAQFGDTTTTAPTSGCLPSSRLPGPVLLPLWDDMDTGHLPTSGVFYGITGVAPHRVFSVEWRHAYSETDHGWHDFSLSIAEGTGLVSYAWGLWGYGPEVPDGFDSGHGLYGAVGAQDGGGAVATGYSCRRALGPNSGVDLAPTTAATVTSPPQAAGVSGDATTGTATITWQPPVLDGGAAITGYYAYINQFQGSQERSQLLPVEARSYSFAGLDPVRVNWLSVAAVNSAGESVPTETQLVNTVPTAPPSTATTSASTATLRWQPPSAVRGSWVTGYRVTRDGVDLQGHGPVSFVRGSGARSQDFGQLRPGSAYTLTVQALSAAGPGAVRRVHLIVPAVGRPGRPLIGTAAAGAPGGPVTASVSWAAPPAGSGATVTGYRVQALRMVDGKVAERVLGPLLRADARHREMSLPRTGTWRFTVKAFAAGGAGQASERSAPVRAR